MHVLYAFAIWIEEEYLPLVIYFLQPDCPYAALRLMLQPTRNCDPHLSTHLQLCQITSELHPQWPFGWILLCLCGFWKTRSLQPSELLDTCVSISFLSFLYSLRSNDRQNINRFSKIKFIHNSIFLFILEISAKHVFRPQIDPSMHGNHHMRRKLQKFICRLKVLLQRKMEIEELDK